MVFGAIVISLIVIVGVLVYLYNEEKKKKST